MDGGMAHLSMCVLVSKATIGVAADGAAPVGNRRGIPGHAGGVSFLRTMTSNDPSFLSLGRLQTRHRGHGTLDFHTNKKVLEEVSILPSR